MARITEQLLGNVPEGIGAKDARRIAKSQYAERKELWLLLADALEEAGQTKSRNPFKVGDMLYSEQTNVDFYVVQRVTKSSIVIAKIDSVVTPSEPGAMSGVCWPLTDPRGPVAVIGEPKMKRVQFTEYGPYVNLNSYSSAYAWDGKGKRCSWYR